MSVRRFKGFIISLPFFLDERFDGCEFKNGVVIEKKSGLPKPSDAAVTIRKGVNELFFEKHAKLPELVRGYGLF